MKCFLIISTKTGEILRKLVDELNGTLVPEVREKGKIKTEAYYDMGDLLEVNDFEKVIEIGPELWMKSNAIAANFFDEENFDVKRKAYINADQELQDKKLKYQSYLNETAWVAEYKLRHDLGLEAIPKDSAKWKILEEREEKIKFLRTL